MAIMNDKTLLRFIDFTGITFIALGVCLLMSAPDSIELIKVATLKEIVSSVGGIVLFFLGGLIYVRSGNIFIQEEKNEKTKKT